jgi:hypothetical protein
VAIRTWCDGPTPANFAGLSSTAILADRLNDFSRGVKEPSLPVLLIALPPLLCHFFLLKILE